MPLGNRKDKIRAIANLYPEDMHLVLPKGEKLGSLKDLNGKRVGVAAAVGGAAGVVAGASGGGVGATAAGLGLAGGASGEATGAGAAGWGGCFCWLGSPVSSTTWRG